MKNYKIYLLVLVASIGTLQSCESYLEEINPNAVSSEIYWSNLTETNESLTSVYGAMLNQYILEFDTESLRSDLGFPKSRTNPTQGGYEWHTQQFDNTISTHYFKSWNAMYRVIFRANQLIAGLEKMDAAFKSEDTWTNQMAQARFLRGLMHFYLHSNYNQGQIIIRDNIPSSQAEFSKKLSTSEEAVAFFREDLQYAYDNLPEIQDVKTKVSKGVAATVLGKSYLYSASEGNSEDYEKAITLFQDVINGPYGYSLLQGEDVKLLFTKAGDFNSESIFELNYTIEQQRLLLGGGDTWDEEAYTTRWARYTAPSTAGGGSGQFMPTSWLTFMYSKETMDFTDSRNKNLSGALNNVSLRCAQSIAVGNDLQSTYYRAKPAYKETSFSGTTFSYFKKFTNHDITETEDDILSTSWQSGKNVTVYRLADVYLMLAECLLDKPAPDVNGAIDNINIIRERWGLEKLVLNDDTLFLDYTSGDPLTTDYITKLRDHLRHVERPLEVGLEGYAERSIDLRRWGVKKARLQYLADSEYQLVDEKYTIPAENPEEDDVTVTVRLVEKGATVTENRDVNIEFNEAAQNFNEVLHNYLPLPNDEILYNQEVN